MFYRRQIPARSISLLIMDVIVVFLAMLMGSILSMLFYSIGADYTFMNAVNDGFGFFREHIPTAAGCSVIFAFVFYAAGMYESSTLARPRQMLVVAMYAVTMGLILVILSFYVLFRTRHFGLGVNTLTAAFLYLGVLSIRYFYRLVVGGRFFLKSALVIGEGESLEKMLALLKEGDTHERFKLMGIVSTSPDVGLGTFVAGIPVVGALIDLEDFVEAYGVEAVLVAAPDVRDSHILSKIRPLRYRGIECMDYIGLHELLAQSIPLDHIDDEWLLHAAMNSSRIHIRKMKRVLDVVVAVFGLVITIPLSLVSMILVRCDSPGPIFYRQRRLGLGGEPYTILKFRTMYVDAEKESGAVWAQKVDARVTRVGKFLRTTRLDEIPQLWNVLCGQMSLVGPRPERPEFVEGLKDSIPFYEERLMMPPGITGWAQVRFPYAASIDASRYKLQYDLYYIKHTSLLFDVSILLRTFKTIMVGLRHSGEEGSGGGSDKNHPDLRLVEPRGLRDTGS